jgi:type IV pilus assembly protein PilV
MFSIKTKGFTLIEVLIAMIVLAFGLLGLAGLQATGLKQNLSAHLRSQATTLAYDFADRVRTNSMQRTTYLANSAGSGTQTASCLATAGCTATQMADHDIFAWKKQITSSLPSGIGAMTQTAGAGTPCPLPPPSPVPISCTDDVFTITINWDDNKDGDVDNADANFSVSFTL